MSDTNYICECGFKFARPGEYRNCQAFVTAEGKSGVVCPKCGNAYIDGWFAGKYTKEVKDE